MVVHNVQRGDWSHRSHGDDTDTVEQSCDSHTCLVFGTHDRSLKASDANSSSPEQRTKVVVELRVCFMMPVAMQWELYCTVATDAKFSVALGMADDLTFHSLLVDEPDAVVAALSKIDVRNAEASNPGDLRMILRAVSFLCLS